jgi:hypothetical protein
MFSKPTSGQSSVLNVLTIAGSDSSIDYSALYESLVSQVQPTSSSLDLMRIDREPPLFDVWLVRF